MHRLHTLRYHRRAIEVEHDCGVAVLQCKRIRRRSVHREIGCLNIIGSTGSLRLIVKSVGCVFLTLLHVGTSCGYGKTDQFSVGEGILLGLVIDGHPSIGPRSEMLGEDRRAVVVVAHVYRHNAWIRLRRERADHVREGVVGKPRYAVIVGFRDHIR